MPLTAEARPKGSDVEYRIVDITRYETPRIDLVNLELRCPECKHSMHVYQSMIRITHFKHNPGGIRDCALSAGEGNDHLCAKMAISEKLATVRGYAGAQIVKEYWLGNVQRRADICVIYPDGGTEVHEIQLAKTTVDSLEERTNDYLRAGVSDIIWWFGGQADNQNNRVWAKDKLGGFGELSITEGRELVL